MPKTSKKTSAVPAAKKPVAPPVAAVNAPREVVYDKLAFIEYSTASETGPLTPHDMKEILGWETEKEYQARKAIEDPDSDPKKWLFYDQYHCYNTKGEKVRCHHNANNRPFDQPWCEGLIHTILHGGWAGPHTIPGETINGEAIRISRHKRVLSGQHQGTALILADEYLQSSRADAGNAADPKYPFWNGHEHPFIETLVVVGLSEDPRVLQTIDYVKPRTVADMLYTMDLFRTKPGAKEEVTPVERKELTRMLAAAIDLLWERTATRGYKTHPEITGFLERHRKLLRFVEHLFIENSAKAADGGRKISKLRLSPGQCAALCYLMASSGEQTDSDAYRNMCPPSEADLDWTLLDKAEEFWTRLAGGRSFIPVRTKIGQLVDSTPGNEENMGLGGRGPEKFAILSKAWEVWRDHPGIGGDDGDAGPPFKDEDLAEEGCLHLSYSDLDDEGNKLPDGKIKLLDVADFGGIDCVEGVSLRSSAGRIRSEAPLPPPPSAEQVEKLREEARERRAPKVQPPANETIHQQVQRELREREEKRKRLLAERDGGKS